jgi:hypothetical protein
MIGRKLKGSSRTSGEPRHTFVYLAAAHALKGDIDEAKTAFTKARRLNPKLSVKWLMGHKPICKPWFDALRKAGSPEE